MGLNLLGVLKTLVKVGLEAFKLFKPGSDPVTYDRGIEFAITQIFPRIREAIAYGGLDTKDKIDAWFDAIDAGTGTDEAAVDIIPSLPAAKEEELFDAVIQAARIFAYNIAKIPGYHTE